MTFFQVTESKNIHLGVTRGICSSDLLSSVCNKGFGENCSSAAKVLPGYKESGTSGTKVLSHTGSVYSFRLRKLEIQTTKHKIVLNRKRS